MRTLALILSVSGCLFAAEAGYVNAATCGGCHPAIARSYAKTGMARSFSRPSPDNIAQGNFNHPPSDQQFTLIRRGDEYFERRHSLNDVVEQRIDYVMGSGNHVRTYLHLDAKGKLTQMPVGWYAENGGHLGMSPNYDNPTHPGFQREISFSCMFCHNAYPDVAPGQDAWGREPRFSAKLPEGIDCQRCHGPGREHVRSASAGEPAAKTRAAILNPKRLAPERQLEVCMQCHLQTTSRMPMAAVVRFDRNVFSYRPGQPLPDYMLHFDYAPAKENADPFEIAHTAYRLRQSACFLKTAGTARAMTCTTCHNPHEELSGPAAQTHYTQVCRQCHTGPHAEQGACVECHMPKRRTDDVVHVAMTDHYIQRRKPTRDLMAPLKEQLDPLLGVATPYYPAKAPALYASLVQGLPQLRETVEQSHPKEGAFYFYLAEAETKSGATEEALRNYQIAVERTPKHRGGWLSYAAALQKAGRTQQAATVLQQALRVFPDDAVALSNLGELYLGLKGMQAKAVDILLKATAADPSLPAAQQNLGLAYSARGDIEGAMNAWREAIRLQPNSAPVHNNLANALFNRGRVAEAETHYRLALRFNPQYAHAHSNYATLLMKQDRLTEAESELRQTIRLDPGAAMAYTNLANVLTRQGDVRGAMAQFRLALEKDPGLDRAHLGLGTALASQSDFEEARTHLEIARKSQNEAVRTDAEGVLRKIQALQR